MNDQSTKCKQCGKVIVGNAKLGLCDSCFNKDAGIVVGGASILTSLGVGIKKHGPKLASWIKKLLKIKG